MSSRWLERRVDRLDDAAMARLARIRQFKEQEEQKVDFKNVVPNTRNEYKKRINELYDDVYLPAEVRYDRLEEVSREFKRSIEAAKQQAYEGIAAEKDRLDRLAYPAPDRSGRTADQVAVRRELREDLERRWSRDPASVLTGLHEAIRLGDDLSVELHMEYGREFISDDAIRMEFGDVVKEQRVARMSPQQLAAVEQLEALEAEASGLLIGIEHQAYLATQEADAATKTRPVKNRDTAIGEARQRGMDTDAVERLANRDSEEADNG